MLYACAERKVLSERQPARGAAARSASLESISEVSKMQKKQANLLSIIFMSVFLVLSFMPIVFTMTYWKNDAPGVGSATRDWSAGVNLYSRYLPLALLIAAAAAVCIVLSIMKLVGSRSKLAGYAWCAAFAAAGLFVVISCMVMMSSVPNGDPGGTATWGYYGKFEYTPAWGFFIECALLIAVCVFGFLEMRGLLVDGLPANSAADGAAPADSRTDAGASVASSNRKVKTSGENAAGKGAEVDIVDELKKYKELLDSEIITQEEFDKKKKELLGL